MNDKIKSIKEMIKNIDKRVLRLIDIGNGIAYTVCIIGILTLLIEYRVHISMEFLSVGVTIFKLGIIIAVGFFVIGVGLGILKRMMDGK